MKRFILALSVLACAVMALHSASMGKTENASHTRIGYYRQPAIYDNTVVFVAEGDLWKVDVTGGVARRLTSHPGLEADPTISPDGKHLAFTGQYEGPTDVFVMPLAGGLPQRVTYFGRRAGVVGWTPNGEVLCATWHYSTLPARQLVAVDPSSGEQTLIPLCQAAEGCYDEAGRNLYFTRFPFQGSYTKRYQGGTAQNIWRYTEGEPEAVPLTTDFPGTSAAPMWYDGRLYFISDRDGTLNLWSSDGDGADLSQLTHHVGWDVKSPALSKGNIVYQRGADLYVYNLEDASDKKLDITLASDFDQLRENWIDKPLDYVAAAHISPDGDRVVLTARGDLFVVPRKGGRLIEATNQSRIRFRGGRFLPDGENLLALSDASGELEFWKIPANGQGEPRQLTDNGTMFRFDGVPSPDGKYIAFDDKNQSLWIYDTERKTSVMADSSITWEFSGLVWSPDSRWLAYVKPSLNFLGQIFVYDIKNKRTTAVTTNRHLDHDPAWSSDGKWLYFLSDRDVSTVFPGVWSLNQPFPLVDKMTKLFMLPLEKGLRSPFEPENELTQSKKDEDKKDSDESATDSAVVVKIDFDGLPGRVMEAPVPAGNYGGLEAGDKQLYWLSWDSAPPHKRSLQTIEIKNEDAEVKTLTDGVTSFELSLDGKKMLIRKDKALYIADASGTSSVDLGKARVDLSDWAFSVDPGAEFRQMFLDAWRLERDYFYDPGMHGVDWDAIRDKYLPLVERITDRWELSDLLGEMVGELSALHIYVFGGDMRKGDDNIAAGFLGARLSRNDDAGGYRVDYIYQSDPDRPDDLSPLHQPDVNISQGDIIEAVNGVPTLSVFDVGVLLRRTVGKQVLLTVRPPLSQVTREVIVKPISASAERNLRYRDWEYSRRNIVEKAGDGDIGYVHLRATTTSDYGQWVRDFFPVFNRKGLIIDLRNNSGGNIDSWILTSLLRQPWAYWQSRVGIPYSNMQLSFGGHMVVLCNEWTASDGELFCEGFRRLGLGKVIGTRTWGGEIWLSYDNWLVDRGIASAAQSGVFAPEGEWLIEGHGVEPDMVVDNLPHATYNGSDAQLEAAIDYLKEQIRLDPPRVPEPPPYPDKSFKPGQ